MLNNISLKTNAWNLWVEIKAGINLSIYLLSYLFSKYFSYLLNMHLFCYVSMLFFKIEFICLKN